MFVKVKSIAFVGINPIELDVEVNVSNRGLPGFDIVGLPSKSVEESRQRVKNAIINSGEEFPNKKITVNLAPADIHKEGSCYDLPIALGIFCASHNISVPQDYLYFGELSMNGYLRYTKRVFVSLLYSLEKDYKHIVIPLDNYAETCSIDKEKCIYFSCLNDVFKYCTNKIYKPNVDFGSKKYFNDANLHTEATNIDDIIGNSVAKRVLLIAASGYHNVLLSGPPGTGKTMLAKSLTSILPKLEKDKSIEVTKIYSYAGKLEEGSGLMETAPFRSPHHTSSSSAILGGGNYAMPGEVTFAHNGILFLDEFCEFKRDVIEALRQPLQDGKVSIIRGRNIVEYPADFLFVASTNPCPCGFYNDPEKQCVCLPSKLNMYKSKLSGPITDRIDLQINVFREKLVSTIINDATTSFGHNSIWQNKVIIARDIQRQRYKNELVQFNSKVSPKYIQEHRWLSTKAKDFIDNAYEKMHLSLRAYFKVIRTARTIADLDNSIEITTTHLAEALQYRGLG